MSKGNKATPLQRCWILIVLSSPIWADTVRRFLWYSDTMFLSVAILASMTVAWLIAVKKNVFRVNNTAVAAFVCLSLWAVIVWFASHNNIKIFSVWILATYLPVFFLIISSYFFATDPDAVTWLYRSCTAWIFVMAVVAVCEVWLGINHPINHLPQEALTGSVEVRQGIGDYTVANGSGDSSYSGIEGIFRPTSIFLSNGKFGQALFTLVLFRWVYLYKAKRPGALNLASILMDAVALLISGQRAALVLLSLLGLIAIVFGVAKGDRRALRILFGGLVLAAVGLSVIVALKPGLADLVAGRYVSGFTDITERLVDNLFVPASTIVSLYGVHGAGPGFFSLGAQKFGGVMMWQVLATNGNAESVWMRIVAELGVVGLVLYLCYHGSLILQSCQNGRSTSDATRGMRTFAAAWLIAIALWGITHDTVANAFGMSIGFGLCGAAFVRKGHSRIYDRSLALRSRLRRNVPLLARG